MRVEGGGAGACRRVGGEGGKVGREERWGGRKGHGGGVGWKGGGFLVSACAPERLTLLSLSLCFSRKKRQPESCLGSPSKTTLLCVLTYIVCSK